MSAEAFLKASRLKLRFETQLGSLSAEDLWDLPLKSAKGANLDDIAVGLHNVLNLENRVSFVSEVIVAPELAIKFEIVRHIIEVRLQERNEAATREENRVKKARILELIAKKQDEKLAEASEEELLKLANEL